MGVVAGAETGLLRDQRISAAFCSSLAVMMGVTYALLRVGFGIDWSPLLKVVGVTLFLINTPVVWSGYFWRSSHRGTWYSSSSAGGIFVLLLTAFAGTQSLAAVFFAAFSVLGAAAAIWNLVYLLRERPAFRSLAGFVAVFALALLWCAGVSWGAGFENPLYVENLAVSGRSGAVDLFFHSSLANMISLHGVSSMGADGLVPIQYHFGSHWLFARWAELVGLPVIDFYQMGYPILIPALWLAALSALVGEIRRFRGGEISLRSTRGVVLIILAAAVIGAMPSPAVAAGGFGIGPFFSESYALMLLAGFYLGGVLLAHLASRRFPVDEVSRSGKFSELLLALVVLPLGIVALGMCKVSTFLFVFPAFGYMILRLGLYREPVWILSFVISVVLAFLALPHLQPSYGLFISPFAYLRYQLPPKWWPYFITLHFFWTWVYVMLRLGDAGIRTKADLRRALRERSLVDVELVTLTSLLGLAPGLLLPLQIEAVYFTDQIRWVSVAMLLGDAAILAKLAKGFSSFRSRGFFGFRPSQVAALFVGVPLFLTFVFTLFSWPIEMVRMNLMTRKEISVLSGAPMVSLQERVRTGRISDLADSKMLAAGLANAPGSGIVNALRSVSKLPVEERRKTVMYIPQAASEFWNLYRNTANCGWVMLTGPALSTVPMLDAFPPPSECNAPPAYGFGLEAYASVASLPRPPLRTDADLCQRASRWGFGKVLVLEAVGSEASNVQSPRNFHFRQVACVDRL